MRSLDLALASSIAACTPAQINVVPSSSDKPEAPAEAFQAPHVAPIAPATEAPRAALGSVTSCVAVTRIMTRNITNPEDNSVPNLAGSFVWFTACDGVDPADPQVAKAREEYNAEVEKLNAVQTD